MVHVGTKLLKGGGVNMVDVYVTLIVYGVYTLDEVVKAQRDEVEQKLKAMGLDGEGKPLK